MISQMKIKILLIMNSHLIILYMIIKFQKKYSTIQNNSTMISLTVKIFLIITSDIDI